MPVSQNRALLQAIAVAAAITLPATAAGENTADVWPPNVIVILADDAGYGDYSFVGNTNLSTPAIDSLARDGAVLSQFFVQPVCSPTRAELLTGRYAPRSGVRGVSLGQERMDPAEHTLANVFHDAGHATGCFGKWHNGTQWPYHPQARGFDTFYGFTEGHWNSYHDAPMEHDGRFVRGTGFIVDDITSRALDFVRLSQADGRPFFCYLALNTPHSPMDVPDDEWNRFRDKPIGLRGPEGDGEDLPFTRAALAMMENLDANVGRVLATLNSLGIADDTIVVFFPTTAPTAVAGAAACGAARAAPTTAACGASAASAGRDGSGPAPASLRSPVRSICCPRSRAWPASHSAQHNRSMESISRRFCSVRQRPSRWRSRPTVAR